MLMPSKKSIKVNFVTPGMEKMGKKGRIFFPPTYQSFTLVSKHHLVLDETFTYILILYLVPCRPNLHIFNSELNMTVTLTPSMQLSNGFVLRRFNQIELLSQFPPSSQHSGMPVFQLFIKIIVKD